MLQFEVASIWKRLQAKGNREAAEHLDAKYDALLAHYSDKDVIDIIERRLSRIEKALD